MQVKMRGARQGQPETPTIAITKTAQATASATDEKGRVITVNKLNALQFYRLTKALGQTASNATTMDLAVLVSSVKEIDGESVDFPGSELQVEALIQRLDFVGLTAVAEALKSLSDSDDGVEAAKN